MKKFTMSGGKQPQHHKGHANGHPTSKGGVTSSGSNEGASAYGLSAGNTSAMKGPIKGQAINAASIDKHYLQHVDYESVCDGGANKGTGNSQLGKHGIDRHK